MNRLIRVIMMSLAVAAGLWLAYRAADRLYLTPRAQLRQAIRESTAKLTSYNTAEADHTRVEREILTYVNRTLGGDLETVDHKFRSRLNRIAEHLTLHGVSVGTGSTVRSKESPARNLFSGGASQRKLRDEIDFVELEGWISAGGTLEQALQLVDSVESEPWLKRIDQIKLDPKDNGERFDVTVKLTTLYLPGRTPAAATPMVVATPPSDRYAALLQTNPFRVPPPPPPPQPKPITDPLPPTGPPPFAYEQWAITGVAQAGTSVEVWLLNQQTKETRRLAVGEKLHEAVLLAAKGDTAEFRLGDQRFTVNVGKHMNDRATVTQ